MIMYTLGRIMRIEAVLLVIPMAVALFYREAAFLYFAVTAVGAALFGIALTALAHPRTQVIYARDGFIIVSLAWLFLSLFGALPFTLSGEIPSYADAFFETVSGFTTTGASILPDPGVLSHGIVFWRSFTHWIGGMGILVLCMAIVPSFSTRSIHIMRAEMPGPIVGKLVPRARDTAKILYVIYIALTLLQIVMLCFGGLSVFDSVVYSIGTAGTGGFASYASSCGSFTPYVQYTIAVFMLLFGINFNLYYLLLIKRFKSVLKSEELWIYLGIVCVSIILISVNIYPMYGSISDSVRDSSFQVTSIISTTGYSTTDFNLWPDFSKAILLVLMLIGACAGSTAGGFKVSRVVLLFKMIGCNLRKLIHPRSISTVKLEGKTVSEETQRGVANYLALYTMVILSVFLILSIEPFGLETNLSATFACFNNIGPGLGFVGPAASYADYSVISKIVLSVAMLLGRLEIYPVLFMLAPSTWMRK